MATASVATKQKELIDINGVWAPQLTEDPSTWKGSSLLSVQQITPGGLRLLLTESQRLADAVKKNGIVADALSNKLIATVFYEASTRTSCSFQAASVRLGAKFIHVDAASSSSKKGETLSDTIRCLACYVDAVVLRHPVQGSVGQVVANPSMTIPVLNAGDGVGEHPTQALLDVFTIFNELTMLRGEQLRSKLTVVMVGDLKHGRTVHSLAKLLAKVTQGILWRDALVLRYCSPTALGIPQGVYQYVQGCGGDAVQQQVYTSLSEAVDDDIDVLYVTRVQKERFESEEEYNKLRGSYIVDNYLLRQAPLDLIILHPLPRVDEIATEVDSDPRAAYFRQMENGMHVRMALLSLVLSDSK